MKSLTGHCSDLCVVKVMAQQAHIVNIGDTSQSRLEIDAILPDLIFEHDTMQNEAILRDFLKVWNLTTSKTKQLSEASFQSGVLS